MLADDAGVDLGAYFAERSRCRPPTSDATDDVSDAGDANDDMYDADDVGHDATDVDWEPYVPALVVMAMKHIWMCTRVGSRKQPSPAPW
jgi:hypothetical protein